MLRQAVLTDLAFKMMSLKNEPKTYKDWLTKADQFYDVTQRLKKLQSGSYSYVPSGSYSYVPSGSYSYVPSGGYRSLPSSFSHRDPNTMDVDAIQLSPAQ